MTRFLYSRLLWPLLALLALFTVNFWLDSGFFSITVKNGRLYGSVIDIFVRAAPLILVSIGMTWVIATGGVDLSVGAVAALAPAVAAAALERGLSLPAALALSAATVAAVGLWNGALVAALGLQPIVATLIAMVAGRGIAQLLLDGQIISLKAPALLHLGGGHWLGLPVVIAAALAFFAFFAFVSRKTAAGLFIEALGSNPNASFYSGLNARATKILVYTVCAFSAGFAGLCVSSNIRAVDMNNLGLYLELDAILAVVIGGTRLTGGRFSLTGSILGALIIQTVATTINTQGVAVEAMLMVKAIVVIAVTLVQSERVRAILLSARPASAKAAA